MLLAPLEFFRHVSECSAHPSGPPATCALIPTFLELGGGDPWKFAIFDSSYALQTGSLQYKHQGWVFLIKRNPRDNGHGI